MEEIPLYEWVGSGEHCFITIEKINRTSLEAREYLARRLNVRSRDIGFAGFKDRRAVARQTFSIAGVKKEDALAIQEPWLRVLDATYHRNKLRTGHLKGNRFRIVVRGVEEGSLPRAQAIVARLRETGVPNFYGPQRFGHFSDSYRIGAAMLRRDPRAVVEHILAPREGSAEEHRELFAKQRYVDALEALPPGRAAEAAMLHTLRRYPGNYRAAVRKIPREMKRMYFSSYQSYLFNWCLRERMEWGLDAVGTPELGDLAFVHQRATYFHVEEADLEETLERAARGEVSPSGPIFGRKMRYPSRRPGALERTVLEHEGLRPQSWLSHVRGLHLNGTRRPYRISIGDATCEAGEDDRSIVLEFELPPGAYATILLEQVMGPGRTNPPPMFATAEQGPTDRVTASGSSASGSTASETGATEAAPVPEDELFEED